MALLAEQDRAEALSLMYSTLTINVIVALIAMAIAVVLSIRISGSIARPVVYLARSATRIAAGDLDLTVQATGPDEIGALARSFNSMTARLREMIGGLERRVVELRAARQALQESEVKYRRMVDTATEGIWVLGGDTLTVFVNAAMSDVLGYPCAEMIGRPVTDFMFEDDAPDHLQRVGSRRRGISENYERRFRRRDGQAIWTWASATPVMDDEGHFAGALAMFTDVTERKLAEDAVRETQPAAGAPGGGTYRRAGAGEQGAGGLLLFRLPRSAGAAAGHRRLLRDPDRGLRQPARRGGPAPPGGHP